MNAVLKITDTGTDDGLAPRDASTDGAEKSALGGRLRFVLLQAGLSLVLTTIVRIVLLAKFGPSAGVSAAETIRIFAVGAHADLVVALAIWFPLMLWLTVVPDRWLEKKWHKGLLWSGCALWWGLQIFLGISEYYFFDEYRSRFNTVAIDYVHYWTEVTGNIREMYPVFDIVLGCVVGAAGAVFLAWALARPVVGVTLGRRLAGAGIWIAAMVAGIATLSIQEVQFSRERLVNEIANNGLVSGITALWTRDLDYNVFYQTMPREKAWEIARKSVATPGTQLTDDPFSLQRKVAGDATRPKLNVVIMLEESLGSEFWGCLNGKSGKNSTTPRLDEIAKRDGLLFDRILADGNRTIRGIEAVLASFPPLPSDSIVARNRTNDVETLAQVLKRDGYSTTFIYPGSGLFDGLRRFATGNGFERFIEERDFQKPAFKTVWGVCNEDLYDRALAEARTAHESGKPFFITTLSVTNHQPFTYPEGRIPQPSNLKNRKNAVRYVDYSFGRFFEQAKKEPFWANTIFVVVADHGARVYGSQTIPIHSYEIPFMVVGPAVVPEAGRNSTPGCQLDVAPTVLGMIGRPYETTFFGHDLRTVPPEQTRAMIHHNRSIGIYRGTSLVTFGLNKTVDSYEGTPWTEFNPRPDEKGLEPLVDEGVALYQVADELYSQERYKVSK